VIGNAVHVMRIATGEIEDKVPSPEDQGKDSAAVALGRKGGQARRKGSARSGGRKLPGGPLKSDGKNEVRIARCAVVGPTSGTQRTN
jgi:hypothetical protein